MSKPIGLFNRQLSTRRPMRGTPRTRPQPRTLQTTTIKPTPPQAAPAHTKPNVRLTAGGYAEGTPVRLPANFWKDTPLQASSIGVGQSSSGARVISQATKPPCPKARLEEIHNQLHTVQTARLTAEDSIQAIDQNLAALETSFTAELSQEDLIEVAGFLEIVAEKIRNARFLHSAESKQLLQRVGHAFVQLFKLFETPSLAKLDYRSDTMPVTEMDAMMMALSTSVTNPLWAARIMEAHQQKVAAQIKLKQAFDKETIALNEIKTQKFDSRLGKLCARLNKHTTDAATKAEIRSQIQEIEDLKVAFTKSYLPLHEQAIAEFLDAHHNEQGIIWEMVQKAIKARDSGDKATAKKLYTEVGQLQQAFGLRNDYLMNEVVDIFEQKDRRTGDVRKRIEWPLLRKAFSAKKRPQDAELLSALERSQQLLDIASLFEQSRIVRHNATDYDGLPGAIAYEPPVPYGDMAQKVKPYVDSFLAAQTDEAKEYVKGRVRSALDRDERVAFAAWIEAINFENKVTKHGLASVFVPSWDVRTVLPIDAKQLIEKGLKAHYSLPGATSTFSTALSSIGLVLNTSKDNGQWVEVPFMIDHPWHGVGPRDAFMADPSQKERTFAWYIGHARELFFISNQKVRPTGRSAGGLLIPELVKRAPELFEFGIAYSSPAPSMQAWVDHVIDFYNGNTQFVPGLAQFIWFNGHDVAMRINALRNHPDIDRYRGVQGLRAGFTALTTEPATQSDLPVVLFLSGAQDAFQYPSTDNDVPEGSVYPDLPIFRIWPEAAKRHANIAALVYPANGHFQWPTDNKVITGLSKQVLALMRKDPTQFKSDPGSDQEGPEIKAIREQIAVLQALQDLTFTMYEAGYTENALLSEGVKRLEADGSDLAQKVLAIWPKTPNDEFADFVLTEPGKFI